MATRVNGGYLNGQFLTGSLRYFAITASDMSAALAGGVVDGRTYEAGQAIPGSAAELAVRVIATRATVVIAYLDSAGNLHVALENTSASWLDEDATPAVEVLQAALVELGATAGFDDVDMTTVEVTEVPFTLDPTSADAIATTV